MAASNARSHKTPTPPTFVWLLLAILLGGGLTAYILGPDILDPTQTAFLLQGDIGVHYLGWAFFRYEAWTFPLGDIPDFYYPQGANVGYTDSIPLMALLFKPFHSILPEDFQYIGIYLLLCQLLQTWMAWLLLGAMGIHKTGARLAGTLILGLAPVWFFRWVHPALCSHYVLIGTLWVYMGSRKTEALSPWIWRQVLILWISAYTHPYLGGMTLALTFAWLLRLWLVDKRWKAWQSLMGFPVAASIILFNWWVIGYFGVSSEGMGTVGLGEYTLNLLSFFDSLNSYSTFVPSLPHMPKQYEGFAYLGLGGMLLLVMALILRFRPKEKGGLHGLWPLWTFCGLMAVYAMSTDIYIGEFRLLKYSWADFIEEKAQVFRATGRFVWPLYYLVLLSVLTYVYHRLNHWKWIQLLFIGLAVIQLVDLIPLFRARMYFHDTQKESYLKVNPDHWNPIIKASDKIMFWPPYMYGPIDYISLPWLAAHNQRPITLGYVARYDKAEREAFVNGFEQDLVQGNFDPGALYVFDPGKLPEMSRGLGKLLLQQLDGYALGISKEAHPELKAAFADILEETGYPQPVGETLEAFFERNEDQICLISVKDEASYKLTDTAKAYLKAHGAAIDQLGFRIPWLAFWKQGKIEWEIYGNDQIHRLEKHWEQGDSLGSQVLPVALRMVASDVPGGNLSLVEIGGEKENHAPNQRGINIVVVDSAFRVKERAIFDTYLTTFHMGMPEVE
ncbi:MAG: DUF6311 domain-containing protein [Bacteroidota bacterium]